MGDTNTTQLIELEAPEMASDVIEVETTRFGTLEIGRDRVMYFSGGLLGFPRATRFALIQTGEDNYFFWLQSMEDPELAFVVCDPQAFVPGYTIEQVPLRAECREELGLPESANAASLAGQTQVLAICNRVGEWLTGNLLGPLVINVGSFVGKQVVLTEKRWSTRQPLIRLDSGAGAGGVDGSGGAEYEIPLRKSA